MPLRRSTRRKTQSSISPIQPPKRKKATQQKKAPRKSPAIVTLCVSSGDESDIEVIPTGGKDQTPKEIPPLTPTNERPNLTRNSLATYLEKNSTSSEQIPDQSRPNAAEDDPANNSEANASYDSPYDSDDMEDIYSIDFKAQRLKVMKEVQSQLKHSSFLEEKKDAKKKLQNDLLDNDICESPKPKELQNSISSVNGDDSNFSFSINTDDIVLSKSAKPRTSRKTKQALAYLKSFSNTSKVNPRLNDSLGLDDDILFLDKECQQKATYRILWGTKYIKLTMNKNEKFLSIYQQLSERNKVSIGEIILSFNNKTVSPDSRPSDIGFTVADVLEGGVLSSLTDEQNNSTDSGHASENSIDLKFQSSDRKGSVTLSINKFDKFGVILEKYAQMKNIDSSKLTFHFDGEKIDAKERPVAYDLEGGECIDVFTS